MSNMSYCRWRNTLQDLWDCYENLYDEEISAEEQRAKDQLIEICRRIVDESD